MRVLAVDWGATSIRVAAVDLDRRPLTVDVVHRYSHHPVAAPDGSLRWDWDTLVAETVTGLRLGCATGAVDSIGVDTWGVDYGLLDAGGHLLSAPHSYRDTRTADWRSVARRIGEQRLYRTTGIQLLGINTIFQLAAHDRAELDAAATLLMLPELVVRELTGAVTGERTSAGTTGLVNITDGRWAADLVDDLGLDRSLLPDLEGAGTAVGCWEGVPVHLVGGHDTASAVAALRPGTRAFVASGTWSLVGAERVAADVSDAACGANFSNEPGLYGGTRFIKNVPGLWILEECRRAWGAADMREIVDAAAAVTGGATFDPRDDRFAAPIDMEAEVRAAAGLPADAGRDGVARCIIDSLATATGEVLAELAGFVGPLDEVCIMGGGSANGLLNRLIAEASGLIVRRGPQEATVLGNALAQGIALGVWPDLAAAREALVVD